MAVDANKQAVIKWIPLAHAVRENVRGVRGFRFHIETQDYRISSNHRFLADAWKDAFERTVSALLCENCRSPIALVAGKWVHTSGFKTESHICFNDPLDGTAYPADADILSRFADEDL